MNKLIWKITFALALMFAGAGGASAADRTACLAPDMSASGSLNWFLGFHPSDDLLTAWCRIQSVPGNVRFNIQWPVSGAHKSWDTNFDERLPAERIAKLVQSLLPVDDRRVESDSGVPFSDVLAHAVQLGAAEAPLGGVLGFAPDHPAAGEIVLWEPLALRVKPVVLAGQEFTLTVLLKPNLGMLAMGLRGAATDVRVAGYSKRFPMGNFLGSSCSDYFPDCEDLPDVAVMHLPLLVDAVRLEATGENMTDAAIRIGQQLYYSNAGLTTSDPMLAFDKDNGNGIFTLHDENSTLTFDARGNGGTKSITIIYKAERGNGSFLSRLKAIGDDYRVGTRPGRKALAAPDSLGAL